MLSTVYFAAYMQKICHKNPSTYTEIVELARKVQQLRRKLNLTQAELAERLGVDTTTVYRWEIQGVMPHAKHRRLLEELWQQARANDEAEEEQARPSDRETHLLELYRSMDPAQQAEVLAYAMGLAAGGTSHAAEVAAKAARAALAARRSARERETDRGPPPTIKDR